MSDAHGVHIMLEIYERRGKSISFLTTIQRKNIYVEKSLRFRVVKKNYQIQC